MSDNRFLCTGCKLKTRHVEQHGSFKCKKCGLVTCKFEDLARVGLVKVVDKRRKVI